MWQGNTNWPSETSETWRRKIASLAHAPNACLARSVHASEFRGSIICSGTRKAAVQQSHLGPVAELSWRAMFCLPRFRWAWSTRDMFKMRDYFYLCIVVDLAFTTLTGVCEDRPGMKPAVSAPVAIGAAMTTHSASHQSGYGRIPSWLLTLYQISPSVSRLVPATRTARPYAATCYGRDAAPGCAATHVRVNNENRACSNQLDVRGPSTANQPWRSVLTRRGCHMPHADALRSIEPMHTVRQVWTCDIRRCALSILRRLCALAVLAWLVLA